jgi:AP-2 complex subunit mu-1
MNQIFIDVLESVSVLLSSRGMVLHAEVYGTINIKCQVSKMPVCKLGLNDALSSDSRKVETNFHPMAQLQEFHAERAVTFVPPDENFELMTYRVTENVPVPFVVIPVIERTANKITVNIKVRATYNDPKICAVNVVLTVPLLASGSVSKLVDQRCSGGRVELVGHALVWKLSKFPASREFVMQAEVQTVAGQGEGQLAPLSLDFEIPMFTASGLEVRSFEVQKGSDKPTPWIKYLTTAGSFQYMQ